MLNEKFALQIAVKRLQIVTLLPIGSYQRPVERVPSPIPTTYSLVTVHNATEKQTTDGRHIVL